MIEVVRLNPNFYQILSILVSVSIFFQVNSFLFVGSFGMNVVQCEKCGQLTEVFIYIYIFR